MSLPDPQIAYTVRAECPDRTVADRFLAWLVGGHMQAVLEHGAVSGHAVRLDEESGPPVIEVRYVFPNRAAYHRYVQTAAPGLRAEGLARFGPDTGIRMSRTLGEIHPPA
ncbi:MAG: DUF4286 family protein [Planctomycetota bacterium]|nr:MAG: DUF4286 family protein [Planctomycetota bacterium]